MIVILLAAVLLACVSLVRTFMRCRSSAIRLFIPALLLGVGSEWVAFSLKDWGNVPSLWWNLWLFVHLPASLALDPLDLPIQLWDWTTIGLYSFIATAIWHFVLTRVWSRRRAGRTLSSS